MTRNARLGANLVNIGYFLSGGTSYTGEMYSGAMIGYDIGKFLEKELPAKYATIGALIGASYRFLTGDDKKTGYQIELKRSGKYKNILIVLHI